MNKEDDNKDIVRENVVFPPQNSRRRLSRSTLVILIIVLVVLAGGFYFYTTRTKTKTPEKPSELEKPSEVVQYEPLSVPEDLIFSQGFNDTGRPWPPTEEEWSKELEQNPLCGLRKAYCERVGYKYADFGCGCFAFDYYDSFNTYTDNEERFTVYYPKLWQQNTENINSSFIPQVKMFIDRKGASCRLVYGLIDEKVLLSSSNASTSSINIKDKELLQITIPFNRELSDEEKAAGYTQSKLIAIPHFPYPVSKFGFIITSGDKQPLLEACASEFNTILGSRLIDYPSTRLTPQSTGILSIQDIFPWIKRPTDPPRRITLLFENGATGKEEAIASDVFSQVKNLDDPFLTGNKLYYLDGPIDNPIIKTVDIFTGENKTVPLPYDENNPIHSFFIKGDMLYYLSGKFCNGHLMKCSLDLKRYNMKLGVVEHLASGLKSRDIDGFNASGDTLILHWLDGCGEYEAFSLLTKSLTTIGSYCYGLEGDEREQPINQFQNLVVGIDEAPYLVVKNGTIFLPAEIRNLQNRISIRVNTLEYTVSQ